MGFSYFPHTAADIGEMLKRIGVDGLDDLYADVPRSVIFDGDYDLPDAMSEMEVRRRFEELDRKNRHLTIMAGGGAYDHYAPAVVPALTRRSEYLTAYTPYQAEISQGTLRYIFEFQSMIATLTGMDCANASMYDGATAAAEAMMMAMAATRKKTRVLLSSTLLPQVREVVHTYAKYHGVELSEIASADGQTDIDDARRLLEAGDVAGVLVPSVNRFGIVEDLSGFAEAAHAQKALLMVYADPSALAVVRTPGEWGADVACGDAQTLGIPLGFGGPYVGFLACSKEHVRKLPGRIVGATTDVDGKRAFVLTLQAREQHIRREKANSNICSNQMLCAIMATMYACTMGPCGMKEVAEANIAKAHYLAQKLTELPGFKLRFNTPFFNEFVIDSEIPADEISTALKDAGIVSGLVLADGGMLWCATEMTTKEDIDYLIEMLNIMFFEQDGENETDGGTEA